MMLTIPVRALTLTYIVLITLMWFVAPTHAQERQLPSKERRDAMERATRGSDRPIAAPIPKVDGILADWLARNDVERVSVLLYLADQPVYRLRPELERRHAFRRFVLEDNTARAMQRGDARSVATAREAEATFTLEFRRELLRANRQEAEPIRRSVSATLRQLGGRDIRELDILNMLSADVPREAIEALSADPRITEIGLNQKSEFQLITSVPALGATAFWNAGYIGTGESVLVTDSGIKADHPVFSGRVIAGVFLDGNSSCSTAERSTPADFNGHGTHVAGIIASAGSAAFPYHFGVAPGLSSIYSAKISCGAGGNSFSIDTLTAVESALFWTPISVVNNSNGGPTNLDDDVFSRRIDEIVDLYDLTWVNAAGNAGPNGYTIYSPGTAYNVISVGAVDTQGTTNRAFARIADFSSRGPTFGGRFKPDLVAPGANIVSAAHNSNGFVSISGTSMAAPHIAGAAVLLRQRGVRDRLKIKAVLINTTDTSGWDQASGWGYANLNRAATQADLTLTGNLPTTIGSVALFKGTLGAGTPLFGTLVWNRWVRSALSYLRDLDFRAYRQTDGTVLDASTYTKQNVEQIAVGPQATSTPVVIKVSAFNQGPGFTEPFAIALSAAGFQPASGMLLATNCTVPPSAAPSGQFQVSCTFRNDGDLPAFTAGFFAGFAGGAVQVSNALGLLGPGQSAVRTFQLAAPSAIGSATVAVSFGGSGYGVDATAQDAFYPIQISSGQGTLSLSTSTDAAPMAGSAGRTVAVTASSGFSWSASTAANWITITGGNSGIGNGTVTYAVAPNPGSGSRIGVINIGAQALTVTQTGPSPVASGPLAGSGASNVFTFRFTHPNGFNQLDVVNALINRFLDGDRACYIAYSRPASTLYLVNDNGPGSGISAGLALGGSGSVSNSQCTVYAAGSSAVGSGNTLTLNLNIQFKTAFAGSRVIYLAARDGSGGNSGWFTQGAWTIPGATVTYPLSGPVSPATGTTASSVISFSFDDQSNANNLKTVWALMNTAIDGRQACYIAYYAPGNSLYLYPDNGDGSQATNIVLTGTNTIENSHCRINAAGSSVTRIGQRLTLNLNLQFKSRFTGSRGIWTAAQTLTDVTSPWTALGNWLVP
jgi:serine protease AprX